jgi:hypothetical protein
VREGAVSTMCGGGAIDQELRLQLISDLCLPPSADCVLIFGAAVSGGRFRRAAASLPFLFLPSPSAY